MNEKQKYLEVLVISIISVILVSGCVQKNCPISCDDNNSCTSDSCSGGICVYTPYCSGTDTSCGCSSCTNCNSQDGWYNKGSSYACCDGNQKCTCQDQEYRNYACSGTSCTYTVTNTQTIKSSCSACNDGNSCTSDSCSVGSCIYTPITLCVNSDGCCPSGCNKNNDNDCQAIQPICGNGVCETGETCSSCSNDCGCTTGKTCCSGSCITPTCSSNSQCNDGNSCTTDTCNNLGTCTASCSNTHIKPCCGDNVCETGEYCSLCPIDCGTCPCSENCGYAEYFVSNPRIKIASIYNFDGETLDYFWKYIYELEYNGKIDIEEPEESKTSENWEVCLTDVEFKKIWAAKTAHSIWLDKNNMLPWRLVNYTNNELEGLFKKELLFPGDNHCFLSVVDYSPSDTYNYARVFVKDNPLDTSYKVINDARKDFRHIFPNDCPDDKNLAKHYTLEVALTKYDKSGLQDCSEKRVSRSGCYSMSYILVGILRSINIPGYVETGYLDGTGHASAFWPSLRKVLNHGDDIYTDRLDVTPIDKLLMSWSYFENKVEPCGKATVCAKNATRRYNELNEITYISDDLRYFCCDHPLWDNCENFFEDQYVGLTSEEVQSAIDKIINLC